MARTKTAAGNTMPGRKTRAGASRGGAATMDKARKESDDEAIQAEWEEVGEELDVISDIDGLLDRPAANRGSECEARRRIEMLREDRMLQQALSDVFDL